EIFPVIPLLPRTPLEKAQVRALALMIASDVHPLNNLRVLNHLKQQFSANEEQVSQWYHHWLKCGFDAFEEQLHSIKRENMVCYGSAVSMADICLIPQVYNAHRFNFNMDNYPLINQINAYCLNLAAFKHAAPEFAHQ
ncbi:MAG: maleylacetoacetate isomerase, partial [bacterium]|nr:maleylacetoacetate isomerase [bacterium]